MIGIGNTATFAKQENDQTDRGYVSYLEMHVQSSINAEYTKEQVRKKDQLNDITLCQSLLFEAAFWDPLNKAQSQISRSRT
jgi:cobalamin-dependent methionine synthase I